MHAHRRTIVPTVAGLLLCLFSTVNCGGGSSGSTGIPLPSPAPAITSFTSAKSSITAGTGTILSYTFANGTGAIAPGIGSVESGGTINIAPTATTTYTLTVTGTAGGTATQALTVTVTPAAPATVTITAGDAQTGIPGSALPIAPLVTVADASGIPIPGLAVAFVVLEGGGQVTLGAATTDNAGRASSGTWSLGSAKGLNRLAVQVKGLPDQVFTAISAITSTDVQVITVSPTTGVVGESLKVAARVRSTYQLGSVVASNGTSTIPLTLKTDPGYDGNVWEGTLSFGTRPRGPAAVTFTAMDVLGHTTDLVVLVTLDRAPVVTVTSPSPQALARPTMTLSATCTDDDPAGPTSLTARVNGVVLATGVTSLSTTINLAAFEGQSINLDITGIDSIRQKTKVTRPVFVESSSNLTVKATLPGPVLDVLGDRILFLDNSGAIPSVCIKNTVTGDIEVIETTSALMSSGPDGFLTQTGALYGRAATSVPPYYRLYEWRSGTLTNLGSLSSTDSLVVSGNWAIYSDGLKLYLRDIGAGVSTLISTSAGNWSNDVSSNGDVAFWADDSGNSAFNIYRWRNGSSLALTNNPYPGDTNTGSVTDGINVVYRKSTRLDGGVQMYRIAMHDGTTETILAPATTTEPSPGMYYSVAGGYVAYLVEDIAKNTQVWRHGPAGETQITVFGTSSKLDAVGPDGTILFSNSASTPRRYRAIPGSSIMDIGSNLGRVIYRDGGFLVLLGTTVLNVNP